MNLSWAAVAPKTRPAGFDAADPADPAYSWDVPDRQLTAAVAAHLDPIVNIVGAPAWAEKGVPKPFYGAIKPDASELALFARAAARRYGGRLRRAARACATGCSGTSPTSSSGCSRSSSTGARTRPALYRKMLNAFADAVHGVHADNVVIAGGTAPFTSADGTTRAVGRCAARVPARVSSASARTSGRRARRARSSTSGRTTRTPRAARATTRTSPTTCRSATCPKMKAVLDAGVRTRKIVSRHRVRFWVTEFSWDTSPPDPQAVPLALQARWVSEAMYTMWRNGVSLVTWFTLVDSPFPDSPYQSGLYFVDGKPKPTLTAFRFPFVALKAGNRLRLWGRTPLGKPGRVVIQKQAGRLAKRRAWCAPTATGSST